MAQSPYDSYEPLHACPRIPFSPGKEVESLFPRNLDVTRFRQLPLPQRHRVWWGGVSMLPVRRLSPRVGVSTRSICVILTDFITTRACRNSASTARVLVFPPIWCVSTFPGSPTSGQRHSTSLKSTARVFPEPGVWLIPQVLTVVLTACGGFDLLQLKAGSGIQGGFRPRPSGNTATRGSTGS
jgi:hypothetical protein